MSKIRHTVRQFRINFDTWSIRDVNTDKIYDFRTQQGRIELEHKMNEMVKYKYENYILNRDIKRYKENVDALNEIIDLLYEEIDTLNETNKDRKQLNDDLYTYRLLYNALLYNEWHKHNEVEVYKSRRHHDGSIPFENDERDWFIVIAILPTGKQISNHYPLESWDYFKIPEYPQVKDVFDGHTVDDVLERLKELIIK